MTHGLVPLAEMERDALAEVANIAMGRAANSLRHLVRRQILLSVPSIEVMPVSDAIGALSELGHDPLIAVREDFRGLFSGRVLLIFPEPRSLDLVRNVVGDQLAADELIQLQSDAVAETGNIVISSWISTIANLLRQNLVLSVPRVVRGDGAAIIGGSTSTFVMFLHVDFQLDDTHVRGLLALLMDLPSLDALRALISDYVARQT